MIEIEAYDPSRHRAQVDAWCDARKYGRFPPCRLPRVGLIVPGVAAAWLYQTDSDVVLLENLISNPVVDAIRRSECLDGLHGAVERAAGAMGAAHVVSFSRLPAVVARAQAHGWTASAPIYAALTKTLEERK